jgi:hypothetical protein
VTEATYQGFLTPELFAACDRDYWRLTEDGAVPYYVLDGTGVTGYEAALTAIAAPAMRLFRERGGREYLVVTTSSNLRMMASALAASAQVPFRFFDSRADAFEYLKSIHKW